MCIVRPDPMHWPCLYVVSCADETGQEAGSFINLNFFPCLNRLTSIIIYSTHEADMKTILSFVIIILSFSAHSYEWRRFTIHHNTNPMTDEMTVFIMSFALTEPVTLEGLPKIYGSCDSEQVAFQFHDGISHPERWGEIRIRFDQEEPFILTGFYSKLSDGFIINPSDTKLVLDELRTKQQLVYQINNSIITVVPLVDADTTMETFEEICPHYP